MRILIKERMSTRYIYVNPINNFVHLFVPIYEGHEISTNNTCQRRVAYETFFDKYAAIIELRKYKQVLEFELQYMEDGHPLKIAKQERLIQINTYLKALCEIGDLYSLALSELKKSSSNLYGIMLKPEKIDRCTGVTNPVFSVNRCSESILCNALQEILSSATVAMPGPKTRLMEAALAALPSEQYQTSKASFDVALRVLTEQCQRLFGPVINFTKDKDGNLVNQESIDKIMRFSKSSIFIVPPEIYIEKLLDSCAGSPLYDLITSPFEIELGSDNTVKLSILTQFFLAHVNVYCVANKMTGANFGAILDASSDLSQMIAYVVSDALTRGVSVEDSLVTFINGHSNDFGLSQLLSEIDIGTIKQKFERTYKTVSASDSMTMDEFTVLYPKNNPSDKFLSYQGSICTQFYFFIRPTHSAFNKHYFQDIRSDFEKLSTDIPNNEAIENEVEVDIEELVANLSDLEKINNFPDEIKRECIKSKAYQIRIAELKDKEEEPFLRVSF